MEDRESTLERECVSKRFLFEIALLAIPYRIT
jgi:hypothetical protein